MEKIILKKVKTKGELELQGHCKIQFNKGVWDYDFGKYVLTAKNEITFEVGGEILNTTPVNSIKEALFIYNKGIYKIDNKEEL
jgi:hypothetical protein